MSRVQCLKTCFATRRIGGLFFLRLLEILVTDAGRIGSGSISFRAKRPISKIPIAISSPAPHVTGANVFLFRPTVSYYALSLSIQTDLARPLHFRERQIK